ncbi:MAG: 16S rRNA (adenine(1518)-N(6)/adenine(1519)-N(6))-dimethyltransferase RsmA [Candidatus Zipacnadales bacterium]
MASSPESLAARTRRTLAKLGFRPRRSRGQTFLINPSIARRIAEAVCCDVQEARVLEIGAGLGALTEALVQRGSHVVAVEIQPELANALRELLEAETRVRIVEADALKADLPTLVKGAPGEWCATGNLPYSAASALLLRLLQVRPPFRRIVAMVQREVGERLLARPGQRQYGSLSIVTAYYVNSAKILFRVPKGAFFPQPQVDSVVIRMEPRVTLRENVVDEHLLFTVIREGFAHRRKQLLPALNASTRLAVPDKETLTAAMVAANIAPQMRAEELDLEAFIGLANALAASGVEAIEWA